MSESFAQQAQKILTDYGKEFTPPLNGNDLFFVHQEIVAAHEAECTARVKAAVTAYANHLNEYLASEMATVKIPDRVIAMATVKIPDSVIAKARELSNLQDRIRMSSAIKHPENYYAEQLPEWIVVNNLAMSRDYGKIDDRYFVSYSSFARHPHKEVFTHFEESTLDKCVLKTWRELARQKDKWELDDE